ncbi:AraC family transcriptional regulator [Paenibacillus montanisoli]|uniref:AraC family transcriptional regulator n=1 Tax=Paenibacillus montanisoli TaxID=2081970 RepID=A0A328U6V8_9BACL|nr:helix-turn-helix domain-containing protein [Paenibacillus montanisoli]RAP77131.1 AraC family transcriptional regulator [Paenibacillus montanisoli]
MDFTVFRPYVNYATRYAFSKGQENCNRHGYSSAIYLISEGKGVLHTCGRTYETGQGSLLYIPAGQPHDWIADSQDPMVHICCYFDWVYRDRHANFSSPSHICYDADLLLCNQLDIAFPYPIPEHLKVEKLHIWIDHFEKFYVENNFVNERTYMSNIRTQSHFLQFIDFFLSFVLKDDHVPDPRIYKLLRQLDQDLLHGKLLPLETYYRELRISRGYFFELFKHATGLPPIQYINQFRINRAKDDLRNSTISVTEIAEKHRFSSVHYFSKLFRQLTGKSPREFRDEVHM